LVGTVADQVEAVEGEGGPGAVSDELLEAGAVGSLDTDTGVQAKAAPVIPGQHILGLVGLQEAVAARAPREAWSAEDPSSHKVLKALKELVGEGGDFVEAKAGFRMGRVVIRVILDPM
jgi:hypothetical protein